MTTCLLGLGSNLGDGQATFRAALAEIDALPDVRLVRRSKECRTRPVGGPVDQPDFLNAAAVIESTVPPLSLLEELQEIETRHGRQRTERWSPRTLDIDLLLYGNDVTETEMLTLPHPRMSFRRFVLEPSAEIAPRMLHPVIGWPIERLLLHLDAASNQVALLTTSEPLRCQLAERIAGRFAAKEIAPPTFPTAENLWPSLWAVWLELSPSAPENVTAVNRPTGLPYAAALFPKLTILLDGDTAAFRAARAEWSTLVRQPGRGPTLRLQTSDRATIEAEVMAAIEAVWPDLGPTAANRLK